MAYQILDKTPFRNVDLVICSKSDLQPLVDAMGKKVSPSFVARVKRMYFAHMNLAIGNPKSPESAILGYCKLVQGLPLTARKDWDAAKTRTFDIGIESPGRNSFYWSAISDKAIKAASEVSAQIAVTVYGPMKMVRKPRKVAPVS
jgi:hypothetical protein